MVDSVDEEGQLDPVAIALDYKSRVDVFVRENGLEADEAAKAVAKEVGVPSRKIWFYLSILKLSAPIRDMLASRELPVRYVPDFVRMSKKYGDEVGHELASLLRERLVGSGLKSHRKIIEGVINEVSKRMETDAKEREVLDLRYSFRCVLNAIINMGPHMENLLSAKPSMIRRALLEPDLDVELLHLAKRLNLRVDSLVTETKNEKKD